MSAAKDDSPEGRVLHFVREQNRPLNSQNVADALQKYGIKKAGVQKALDSLASRGVISFKDYGKQRIFMAKQGEQGVASSEELEAMGRGNVELQGSIIAAREACNGLERELKSLESTLSEEQLKTEIERLTKENAAMETKLAKIEAGGGQVSEEERKKVEANCGRLNDLWRKRKRTFNDFWDAVTSNMPGDLSTFREELGIETDEDVGCKLGDFQEISVKKVKR